MAEPKDRKVEDFAGELREALAPLLKKYDLTSIRIEAKTTRSWKVVGLKFKTGPFCKRFF